MFEKFAEVSLSAWAIVIALVLVAVVMIVIMRGRQKWTTRMPVSYTHLKTFYSYRNSTIAMRPLRVGPSICSTRTLPIPRTESNAPAPISASGRVSSI